MDLQYGMIVLLIRLNKYVYIEKVAPLRVRLDIRGIETTTLWTCRRGDSKSVLSFGQS